MGRTLKLREGDKVALKEYPKIWGIVVDPDNPKEDDESGKLLPGAQIHWGGDPHDSTIEARKDLMRL